ncbi:MAG: IS630 family transposase [Deltaproteobacteria bacterium]|jgi:transposase|nr:IS630 family transposase [Deltaproteobacteria bacterium]
MNSQSLNTITHTYPLKTRTQFLTHLLAKESIQAISLYLLVSLATVYRWWNGFKQQGNDGLIPKKTGRPQGSGRKLSPEQEAVIIDILIKQVPTDIGLNYSTWQRKGISELIKKKFDIDIAVTTVGKYLKLWNFSKQKPLKKSHEQDPDKVAQWLEDFREIHKRALEEKADIYFADETGVKSENPSPHSYAPKGNTPTIMVTGKRLALNIISAVSAVGKMFYSTSLESIKIDKFIGFMGNLSPDHQGKFFLQSITLRPIILQRLLHG